MCRRLFAEVLEVHSGDDLILLVEVGIGNLYQKVRARLDGVDTPDAFKAAKDTEAGRVRDDVLNKVRGKKCQIEVLKEGKSSCIIRLFVGAEADALCLNDYLREQGYIYEG